MIVHTKDYLVSARIEIGSFFDVPPADAFLELREPDAFDSNRFGKVSKECAESGDQGPLLELFREVFPRLIIDHNLYKDEKTQLTPTEVVGVILDKTALLKAVLGEYSRKVLFTLGKKSGEN